MEVQINEISLIQMFLDIDDFCQDYEKWQAHHPDEQVSKWTSVLFRSEAMTILVYYHHSGYKCFQYYYERLVLGLMKSYFPKVPTYKYFLKLIPRCFDLIFLYATYQSQNTQRTGIYYVDSKRLPVCHNKRIHSHRVFKDIAQRGKSSTGWFYGLKVHLIINNLGEIVSFLFSSANFTDNNQQVLRNLLKGLKGYCYGDKGYLTKLFEEFYTNGLKLVTKIRRNMKNQLMPIQEKYDLMKRGVIESVNDILMTVCDIEHTRHRSPINAMTHMISALIGYNYLDNKPTVIIRNLLKG
jgi:hypothetical protein